MASETRVAPENDARTIMFVRNNDGTKHIVIQTVTEITDDEGTRQEGKEIKIWLGSDATKPSNSYLSRSVLIGADPKPFPDVTAAQEWADELQLIYAAAKTAKNW